MPSPKYHLAKPLETHFEGSESHFHETILPKKGERNGSDEKTFQEHRARTCFKKVKWIMGRMLAHFKRKDFDLIYARSSRSALGPQ